MENGGGFSSSTIVRGALPPGACLHVRPCKAAQQPVAGPDCRSRLGARLSVVPKDSMMPGRALESALKMYVARPFQGRDRRGAKSPALRRNENRCSGLIEGTVERFWNVKEKP